MRQIYFSDFLQDLYDVLAGNTNYLSIEDFIDRYGYPQDVDFINNIINFRNITIELNYNYDTKS